MASITNRVKFGKYFWSLFSETNIFAFEIKVILGLKSTCPDRRRLVGWSGGQVGEAEVKTNSAQLKLGLGLSLAKKMCPWQ